MTTFQLSQSQENLTSHSGLALVGAALNPTGLDERSNAFSIADIKSEATIRHSDVLRSYIGLLCQGKTAYEAVEDFRGQEPFFGLALGIAQVPSCATLRQRLNQLGQMDQSDQLLTVLKEESAAIVFDNGKRRHLITRNSVIFAVSIKR